MAARVRRHRGAAAGSGGRSDDGWRPGPGRRNDRRRRCRRPRGFGRGRRRRHRPRKDEIDNRIRGDQLPGLWLLSDDRAARLCRRTGSDRPDAQSAIHERRGGIVLTLRRSRAARQWRWHRDGRPTPRTTVSTGSTERAAWLLIDDRCLEWRRTADRAPPRDGSVPSTSASSRTLAAVEPAQVGNGARRRSVGDPDVHRGCRAEPACRRPAAVR